MNLPTETRTPRNAALPTLREGDIVDVVAPGSACSRAELSAGARRLESWGLVPRIPRDLFGKKYIYAHTDETRWRHLSDALKARDSAAVWCVRGGYGSLRLVPRLARMRPPAKRKLLIGFSDVTALHVQINERWCWPVLHAAVLAQLGRDDVAAADVEETRALLFGERLQLRFAGLKPLAPPQGSRPIRARIAGGNLKTIQSLLGTPGALPASDSILFFEDVNERGYAIDRMLAQLAQSGSFAKTRAIVLGEFVRGNEPNGRSLWRRVFSEFAQSVRFPVLSGLPIGHGGRVRPLPLGPVAELDPGPGSSLFLDCA